MAATLDRFRGCLLGLAAGDALGTTLEFASPGSFEPIDDMAGGGPFGLEPGQWTDDTSMALCLATSLIDCEDFDPVDQMERYVRWWREGYLSSTGRCFDIGNTVRDALSRFERDGDPYAGSTDPQAAGNGSLMRLAPVPMYYQADPLAAIGKAADSSRTTHGAREAVDACRYFAGLLVGALDGVDKETLLSAGYSAVEGMWDQEPLVEGIARIADGSFTHRNPPEIRGTGYVVRSLEAALWAFYHSDSFRDGALLAANLGDDADTTAAVYGQIAGACYGVEAIPASWREQLTMGDEITSIADDIFYQASQIPGFSLDASDIREVGTVTDESLEIAGVKVRRISVLVSGHTVEQVLSYDIAEAEAVFRRPFNDMMDSAMRAAMYSANRVWLDETMLRVAVATSYVLDGKCVRTAKILHCGEIEPASASWVFTRADGTPVEREPWSCVPGTAPMSHLALTSPEEALSDAGEDELRGHIESYEWFLREVWGIPRSELPDHLAGIPPAEESTITALRYASRPNGQRVRIDDQGWGVTRAGMRDRRYRHPIGPPLA